MKLDLLLPLFVRLYDKCATGDLGWFWGCGEGIRKCEVSHKGCFGGECVERVEVEGWGEGGSGGDRGGVGAVRP